MAVGGRPPPTLQRNFALSIDESRGAAARSLTERGRERHGDSGAHAVAARRGLQRRERLRAIPSAGDRDVQFRHVRLRADRARDARRRHPLARQAGPWPALRAFGFGFLTTSSWNPVTERFGALAPIVGTLLTSVHRAPHRRARRASASRSSSRNCAPPRCAGRSASRSSFSQACPPSSTASGACSSSRRSCRSHVQPADHRCLRGRPRDAGHVSRGLPTASASSPRASSSPS